MTGAFAYMVDVTPATLTPSATNPLTSTLYFKFNIDINTYTISSGPTPWLDFNSDSLAWYSVTDSNTMIAATYEYAVPSMVKFGVPNYHNAQNGDFNFKFIVTNGQGDVNYETGWTHAWSDENAPQSTWGNVYVNNGNTVIEVYAKDGMTAQEPGQNALPETAQGSGVEFIWFSDNGGPWTSVVYSGSPLTPTNITLTEMGDHTVLVCASDRLDTNSCAGGAGEWEKTTRVEGFASTTCNLVNLILFVLAAVLLITIVIGSFNMATEGFNTTVMGAIIVSAISVVIIIFVASTVSGIMCVV